MMRNLVRMRIFLVSQIILILSSAWTNAIEHKSYLLDTEDGWDVLVTEETEDKALQTKYTNEEEEVEALEEPSPNRMVMGEPMKNSYLLETEDKPYLLQIRHVETPEEASPRVTGNVRNRKLIGPPDNKVVNEISRNFHNRSEKASTS